MTDHLGPAFARTLAEHTAHVAKTGRPVTQGPRQRQAVAKQANTTTSNLTADAVRDAMKGN